MITIDTKTYDRDLAKLADNFTGMMTGDATHVDIFVPINSPAGQYAAKIHDGKGKTWSKRGVGTVAKGSKADAKYIERAIDKDESKITRLLNDGWIAVVKALGRGSKMRQALTKVGILVQRDSIANAPCSPTKGQYKKTLKTARGRKRSTFKATPGGLEKSIKYEVG